ncbi:hypothetical protein RBB50_007929 [Rhinocladiella similis]
MSTENTQLVLSTTQDGRTKDLRYRQRQFRALHEWMSRHPSEIQAALQKDDGLSELEAQFLFTLLSNKLREFYDSLDLKTELANEYSIKAGRDNAERMVSEDLTYVIPAKWALIFNVFSVLYACMAAGSCCVVELPKDLRDSTSLVRSVFREALDKTAFITVSSRPPVDFLTRCIVVDQTGSISAAGMQRLISSETGGAAVAIVDRTADVDQAAKEILKSRMSFSGRGPYAPRYIIVNEFVEAEFLDLLRRYNPQQRTISMNRANSSDVIDHAQPGTEKDNRALAGEIVLEQPCFRLIRIPDRNELWNPLQASGARSVKLLATSSHDDAIDAINGKNEKALLALYVFADPSAAKYLSQFIRTRVSFVNHIPTNILVWPSAPVGYPVSPDSVYSRTMIESPSPQFVHPGEGSLTLEDLAQDRSQRWEQLYRSSLRPLKPTSQPNPGSMNFFKQGLLVGAVFYLFPIIAVTASGSAVLLQRLWRWRT